MPYDSSGYGGGFTPPNLPEPTPRPPIYVLVLAAVAQLAPFWALVGAILYAMWKY